MVNVAHYRNNRCAWLQLAFTLTVRHYRFFQLVFFGQGKFVAHFFTNYGRSFLINYLIDGRHSAHFHHGFNNF